MLANKNQITEYIPQRFPIVMVDSLLDASDEHAITELFISPDNVFVSNGKFAEPGLVENIAQTAAVHVGFQCRKKGVPVPIGYIAAISGLRFHGLPPANQKITTSVKITNKVLDVTVVEGKVEIGDTLFCSCEMKIFAKVNG